MNIPDGYRQQVWDLIDSGKWFFSDFANPFAKRPPGWWWALDRDGDVGRSFKYAALMIGASLLLMLSAGALASACMIRMESAAYSTNGMPRGPRLPELGTSVEVRGVACMLVKLSDDLDYSLVFSSTGIMLDSTSEVTVHPSFASFKYVLALVVWLLLIWMIPALVGIWSQIRQGLPSFARAPRTIIAAANYEAHRFVCVAILFTGALAADCFMRVTLLPDRIVQCLTLSTSLFLAVALLSALSWVGPLRSDYTRQLIRSRLHAVRILLMYGVAFPIFGLLGVAALMWGP